MRNCSHLDAERCADGSYHSFDGYSVVTLGQVKPRCALTVLQINLSEDSTLRGQVVYIHVQANVRMSQTSLTLTIDPGGSEDAHGLREQSLQPQQQIPASENGWRTFEYQATLANTGTARFGLLVSTENPSAAAPASVVAELGSIVDVAPVGDAWDRIKTDDDAPKLTFEEPVLVGSSRNGTTHFW